MRLFINCSEPVRHDSHQLFLERFTRQGVRAEMLAVSYAMAENTFAVTQSAPGQAAHLDVVNQEALAAEGYAQPVSEAHPQATVRVSCGRPIPNTEVQIIGDDGLPLAERQSGEIAIRSDCLLTAYYRRPDLHPFQNGWYLSGDIGYLAEGELYVIGRRKEIIIHAGKNIYPQDIEAVMNGIEGIHPGRVVAFGIPDEREGTELVVVVAETPAAEQNKAAFPYIKRLIRQEVAQQLGVTVSYVHLVGSKWLLKTSSGKIARGANRDKWVEENAKEIGGEGGA
jgi:acyl-CoA synthetase (AMP-forming)/AMP-acid ligase II